MEEGLRIGFVASRLAGTDGVSLEARKWHHVFQRLQCECFCFCSRTDWPEERAYLSEECSFSHEEIAGINHMLFVDKKRTPATGHQVTVLKEHLKKQLHEFVKRFDLTMLVAENSLSLPMNIPLGLAMAEYIAEHRIPTIAHHHDFWWERIRYTGGPAEDYLRAAFPPVMSSIRHVVINSVAERELAFRTGGKSTLIPNAMDFAAPPPPPDGYADDMRESIGVGEDECLILQPTRIVPRKRIEQAIELVRRLTSNCALVVTHDAGDEGEGYVEYLRRMADMMDVRLLMPSQRFHEARSRTAEGEKVYAMSDAYQQADLVTYCSSIEGFGNAFLETIYHKRPLLMSAYEIFSLDIEPKGFQILSFQDYIPDDTVQRINDLLHDPDTMKPQAETNYRLGHRHYSFEVLEENLRHIAAQCAGKR